MLHTCLKILTHGCVLIVAICVDSMLYGIVFDPNVYMFLSYLLYMFVLQYSTQ